MTGFNPVLEYIWPDENSAAVIVWYYSAVIVYTLNTWPSCEFSYVRVCRRWKISPTVRSTRCSLGVATRSIQNFQFRGVIILAMIWIVSSQPIELLASIRLPVSSACVGFVLVLFFFWFFFELFSGFFKWIWLELL